MIFPTITELPIPPSRLDPANFSARADEFLGALPQFQTEMNTAGDFVSEKSEQVATDLTIVTEFKDQAEQSAVIALGAANFKGQWENITGSLEIPASVMYDEKIWILLQDISDVTTVQPGSIGSSEVWMDVVSIASAAAAAAAATAVSAATVAESARDAALIQAGVYATEAAGRAAVADGQAFKVQGSGDVAAYEYRRVNSTTSTLIATYPSSSAVGNARQLTFDIAQRTNGVAVLPPVTLGMRAINPTELSFDLRVTRGEWADTGLPWSSDGRYAGLALLPDVLEIGGRAVSVTHWSFDLRPVSGVYLDTGSLWPPTASADQASYPPVVVKTSGTEVNIYRKAGSATSPTYTQWHMIYQDVTARNCRVWRTDRVFEATYLGDGNFAQGRKIVQASEVETAVNINGAYDFAGGYIHGNEELTGPAIWLADGAQFDPADELTVFCDRVELIQPTQLFLPGGTSGTVFVPKGAAFASLVKQASWTRDAYSLKTRLTELTSGLAVKYAFLGMLPIQRIDDTDGTTQITHTAIRNPLWVAEDVSTADFGPTETTANEVRIWGDRYGASLRVLAGWTDPSRLTYVDDRPAYNKVYASFYRNNTHITAAGAVLDAEVQITLNIMEPQ